MVSSIKQNRNDFLWGGESFVSDNCRYLLTMRKDGNLVLEGITERYIYPGTRRLLANYTWYNGWQTNTKIFNYSGKSIPKLILKNGAFYIIEYMFKGWEGKTIELWSNAGNISSDTDEMTLSITNIACLSLRDDNLFEMGVDDPIIWNKCSTLLLPDSSDEDSTTTTEQNVVDSSSSSTEEEDEQEQNVVAEDGVDTETLWWVWLLVVLLILILFGICFGIKKHYFGINRQKWISSTKNDIVGEHKTAKSYDDDDTHSHSRSHDSANDNNALDEWIRETKEDDDGYHYGEGSGVGINESKSSDGANNDSIEMAKIEIMSDGPMTTNAGHGTSTFNRDHRDLENEIFGDVMIMDNDTFYNYGD